MVFSTIDYIAQPKIFIGKRTFIIGTLLKFHSKSSMIYMVSILCGSFGSTISIFVLHFMFRFFALERRGRLYYFKGKYLAWWFIFPFFPGCFWGYITYLFLQPNDLTSSIVLDIISPLNLDDYSYISATYFLPSGELNLSQFLTMFILMNLMLITILTVAYFAIGSYRLINRILKDGESEYSRKLQKQLFLALVCQAIIPSILMYIPVGSLCILPFFDITIPNLSTIVTATYALYPAFDPLPLIIIVDSYRNVVRRSVFRIRPMCTGIQGRKVQPVPDIIS
ncbi:unnamed protein product [Caenorhabditis angaria]|uniref:Seven TM Receptor n=1 Tax=Caenorhabditis angaria TaxID=860376 RepID=A0A9P1N3A5_9PELO|nr:unnamed protein product [Caenorhabditis angaria]